MDYQIEEKGKLRLLGKVEKQFANDVKADAFWKKCDRDGTLKELWNYSSSPKKELIGLADGSSYDGEGYQYYIATLFDGEKIPKGYVIKEIPESLWIRFRGFAFDAEGSINQELRTKIYSDFFPTLDYEPVEYQLEVYLKGEKRENFEVWIAVVGKGN
ncbi:hypothetical protein IGI39_004613 [Enterococcus sp. AZ135]|uniref:GyrI-like domain-containing protein n=1 Tax=unclassified Enterococcus TaxID=2608891 RepID=UPI003F233CA9